MAVLALAAQDQPPTFRATTRLVELTVTALDKKGQAVTDLRAGGLHRPGQRQGPARHVLQANDGEPSVEPATLPLPPGVFSNRAELSPGPPRNVTALVLDELNTPTQFRTCASAPRRRATSKRWRRDPRRHRSTSARASRILHDFTDDADSLRSADREGRAAPCRLQNETDFSQLGHRGRAVRRHVQGRPGDGSSWRRNEAHAARSRRCRSNAQARARPPRDHAGLDGESRAAPGRAFPDARTWCGSAAASRCSR